MAYVNGLPPDSNFYASVAGGQEHRGWNVQTHLLASVIDAINNNTYVLVRANSKKGKSAAPKPVPRPETRKATKSAGQSKFALMARMAHKAGHQQKG